MTRFTSRTCVSRIPARALPPALNGRRLATPRPQTRRETRGNDAAAARCTTAVARALLTGPPPQCIALRAAGARRRFRYCLGLRGGGSSHFAPIRAARLRRDQSSGGGGWDECAGAHAHARTFCSLKRTFLFTRGQVQTLTTNLHAPPPPPPPPPAAGRPGCGAEPWGGPGRACWRTAPSGCGSARWSRPS